MQYYWNSQPQLHGLSASRSPSLANDHNTTARCPRMALFHHYCRHGAAMLHTTTRPAQHVIRHFTSPLAASNHHERRDPAKPQHESPRHQPANNCTDGIHNGQLWPPDDIRQVADNDDATITVCLDPEQGTGLTHEVCCHSPFPNVR